MELEEEIENTIGPIIKKMGYKLIKVKLGFQNRDKVLTITIDKEGGVSVEDCAKVSRAIAPILDGKEIIKNDYILIVSSPGIE